MKSTSLFVFTFCVLSFYGCTKNADYESDKQAITKMIEEWDLNAESGNLADNAEQYTEDAVRIGKGTVLLSKDEIHEAFQSFGEQGKITQNDNRIESFWVSGDLAAARGSFSGTFIPKEDGVTSTVQAAGTSVYQRQSDGSWKMVLTVFEDLYGNNKEVAAKYHELNPDDMDDILTDNFIGRNEKSRFTWNKDNHKNYWTNNRGAAKDKIFHQVAEDNWVATWFSRTSVWEGDTVEYEMMHFKRFEDGKIAEIREYGDTQQLESE